MKTFGGFTLIRLAALALVAACFAGARVNAQTPDAVDAGRFTLPYQTTWGGAVLPPGEYSFRVDQLGESGLVEIRRGMRTVGFFQISGLEEKRSGHDALTVIRDGNRNTVSEMSLPEIGELLHFQVPKARRSRAIEAAETAQVIPIRRMK